MDSTLSMTVRAAAKLTTQTTRKVDVNFLVRSRNVSYRTIFQKKKIDVQNWPARVGSYVREEIKAEI